MTSTAQENTQTPPDNTTKRKLAAMTGSLALMLGIVLLSWSVLLPFFWPPTLKSAFYQQLYTPILLLGLEIPLFVYLITPIPFLVIWGFSYYSLQPAKRIIYLFGQALGFMFIIGMIFWVLMDALRLYKLGWMALRPGPIFVLDFKSFILFPGVIALGAALITQKPGLKPSHRPLNISGILLTTLAYQSLIMMGLYFLFYQIVPNRTPFVKPAPPPAQMVQLVIYASLFTFVIGLVGTLLMRKGLRIRFHLLLTFPCWIPFFLIFFFWSLLINTTLYFLEDLFGVTLQIGWFQRIFIFSFLSLILFPLMLTIDFILGLTRLLGYNALQHLFPRQNGAQEQKVNLSAPIIIYSTGGMLLITLPFWLPPLLLYWGIRLFIYESILSHLLGQPAFPANTNDKRS